MSALSAYAPTVLWSCFFGLLILAAVLDLWKMLIPNIIPAALVVLFVITALASPAYTPWLEHAASAGIVFVMGLVLFAVRAIGGGDAKLWTAVALWFDLDQVALLCGYIFVAGGILALAFVVARLLAVQVQLVAPMQMSVPRLLRSGEPVPYGIAISAGTAFLAPQIAVFNGIGPWF